MDRLNPERRLFAIVPGFSGLTKVNGSRNIPKIHGLAVYIPKEVSGSSDNHIGIYVGKDADGNDIVIDARNSKKGIQKSSLNSWAWNDWLKISGIDYPKANTWVTYKYNNTSKKFYYGSNGEFVCDTTLTIDGRRYRFRSYGKLRNRDVYRYFDLAGTP